MINNRRFKKTEKKQVGIMILIFIGIVPALLFAFVGISNVNIYVNKNEYQQGIFIVNDIKCPSDTGSSQGNCTAYGKVNNIETEVYLGLYPGSENDFRKKDWADLGKKTHEVFYRPNGKQTLLKKENELELNAIFYLKKGILELIFPLIIYPLFIVYYKHLTKKLKTLKDE